MSKVVQVSDSQIVDVATARPRRAAPPLPGRRPPTLSDVVTAGFFAEGNRQERDGVFIEAENVRLRSLDRVPRRWWPLMLVFGVLMIGAFAGGWWLGFSGRWWGLILEMCEM